MLGLREQVHRHPFRVAAAIGDDQHFGRAGDHVDAHGAEHAALGSRHVGIAGADDLVDLGNGLRAIGQRRHRLRATDREHPVDAGDRRRRQHQRIALAIRRRHDHDQLTDTRHLGRYGVHEYRTGVSRPAARYVQPDAVERRDDLPEPGAIEFGEFPALRQLPHVIALDTLCRHFERGALRIAATQPVLRRVPVAAIRVPPRRSPRAGRNAACIPEPLRRPWRAPRRGCR